MVRISHINLEKEGLRKFMSPYEADILQTLWNEGDLTSTEIQECLKNNDKKMHIATVSGLLNRLMDAGYVTREAVIIGSKQRYLYSALADEKEVAEQISHSIMENLKDAFGSDFHSFMESYTRQNFKMQSNYRS